MNDEKSGSCETKIKILISIVEYLNVVDEELENFIEKLYDVGGEICSGLVANDLEAYAKSIRKEASFIRKMAEAIQAWEEVQ